MEDIFVPKSSSDDALVGPLKWVTLVTGDKSQMETILCEGYGLSSSGWARPSEREREAMIPYLGLQVHDDWQINLFQRSGHGANVGIRVIQIERETPAVRPTHNGLYRGGATLSFPITDLYAHEKWMAGIGVESTIGVKEMEFTSPTGETYVSAEIVYKAPDGVFFMGVKRPDIFVPVGPIDEEFGIGGAAYSARCISKTSETLQFFENVLGFEIRRDVEFTVGARSAIVMPEGTTERFIQGFAPGSASGYIVLMDHGEATKVGETQSYCAPNRGIVMWSFQTQNLDEVLARASDANIEVVFGPTTLSELLGIDGKSVLMKDPDGFVIEVYEK